jgi:hypothetical protein
MTRVEKVVMAILILAIIGTVIFWKDVRSGFSNNRENVVENELKNDKKDKKDSDGGDKKKKKNKDNKNESFLHTP